MKSTTINAGINTDSFITGYSRSGKRPVRHLRIEDDASFVKIYAVGSIIGKGTFGTVFEVRDMKDNKTWATKVIEKKNVSASSMKALEREISILKVLNHPHIIILREILESATKIYLIMEKCFTDLLKFFNESKTCFNEENARRVISDLTSAITYLHKNDIVHRDVKLENILVTVNPENSNDHLFIKLTDFGLSIVKSGHGITNMLHDRCGTLSYMAPEILAQKTYSQQCDVWAIGIITFYMLTGAMPFEARYEAELIQKICNDELLLTKYNFCPELKDLFGRVLNKDPAGRITAAELLNHPWLRGKKMIDNTQSHNVIDMMRLCNKDMRVQQAQDDEEDVVLHNQDHRRSAATVSVKNVTFDKRNRRTTTTTTTTTNNNNINSTNRYTKVKPDPKRPETSRESKDYKRGTSTTRPAK